MSNKELIKKTAKKCLGDKWYDLIEDGYDWEDPCAFCHLVDYSCPKCLIENIPICSYISYWEVKGDKSVIIEALEELARNGEISPEMDKKLRDKQ